ncbi:MAG: hypothetical protein HY077_01170 [Elusimicrobia bacterium]|nr:hypothetical protein [Elusimicrobiota bacterium]
MNISILLFCAALARSGETKVKLGDLPPAVQKTIKEKSAGAKIKRILKDASKDATTYEAEMTVAGRDKNVTVDSNGNLVEVEETVDLKTLPLRTQGAIEAAAAGGKILKVESLSHGGPVESYEALIKKAGKKTEFHVDPEGRPLAD